MNAKTAIQERFELNPFSQATGDWNSHLSWVSRCIQGSQLNGAEGSSHTNHSSATSLPFRDNYFDAVLTDPPYYDNVPYAALSDFFYVWLKRAVGEFFPELFATPVVPKTGEAIMEPTRHENKDEAKTFFEETLGAAFREIHRILKPGGIAVIVYAHKTTEGWETMLNGLVQAGLDRFMANAHRIKNTPASCPICCPCLLHLHGMSQNGTPRARLLE